MKKRILALVLAAVMALSLAACTKAPTGGTAANADPLTSDDVIKVVLMSHPSWPYQDNWKVVEYIRESVGATVDITAIPNLDVATKYSTMFADPASLPDICLFDYKGSAEGQLFQGALVALDDYEEYMPNYVAWKDSLSDVDYDAFVTSRKSYDGKVYYTPVVGRETSEGVMAWLYRKDIFEKHNLKVPTTFDELYEVSKELKALYPNSYPFCVRNALKFNLNVMAPSFDANWAGPGFYYDFADEKWKHGSLEEPMREALTFFNKMAAEGLMTPDYATLTTSAWQELITSDRGFITPEYQTRIDFFNSIAKDNNQPLRFTAMVPPVANAEKGTNKVLKNNLDPYGFVLCNTMDEGRIVNAAKFLDWFYSDEAYDLVSWGKEGETYEVVNGEKQFIRPEGSNEPIKTLYGFSNPGLFLRADTKAVESTESEDISEVRAMVIEHTMDKFPPTKYLSFTPEESEFIADKVTAITSYTDEIITKIATGQAPISMFDEMVEEANKMGLAEVLETYETAYARIK